MADAIPLTNVARPVLPAEITVSQTPDIRFSPNEMRRLKVEAGRTMDVLMGEDADPADRLQALVWLQLARDGYAATWDEAGDVAIRFEVEPPDPTNAEPSTPSPGSAGSGV